MAERPATEAETPTPSHVALTQLMAERRPFATLPTPLHHMPRLSSLLGIETWIKRDDLTGFAMGGNKVRKLELLVADAVRSGADTLVSVGAAQSNHARTVAAAAAAAGLRCELVLAGRRPKRWTGNLVLDALFGANLHFAGSKDWHTLTIAAEDVARALADRHRQPYLIPVGGSVPLGAIAFAAAYLELRDQCRTIGLMPKVILLASSSGGTQAGLELGRRLAGDHVRIVGVDVAKIGSLRDGVADLAAQAGHRLGVEPWICEPIVLGEYLGRGYGQNSKGSTHALKLLSCTEGIVGDPVYTAKALDALCSEPLEGPVVFWHTGGVPAIFA